MFEGQLFLARHLLILKEMTQNLDLVHRNVDRGLDLSGVNGKSDDNVRTHSFAPATHTRPSVLSALTLRSPYRNPGFDAWPHHVPSAERALDFSRHAA